MAICLTFYVFHEQYLKKKKNLRTYQVYDFLNLLRKMPIFQFIYAITEVYPHRKVIISALLLLKSVDIIN